MITVADIRRVSEGEGCTLQYRTAGAWQSPSAARACLGGGRRSRGGGSQERPGTDDEVVVCWRSLDRRPATITRQVERRITRTETLPNNRGFDSPRRGLPHQR